LRRRNGLDDLIDFLWKTGRHGPLPTRGVAWGSRWALVRACARIVGRGVGCGIVVYDGRARWLQMLLGVWAGCDCCCEVVVEVGVHGCTCCLAVAVGGRLLAVAPRHRRVGVRQSLVRSQDTAGHPWTIRTLPPIRPSPLLIM
jgi:hypothetical protein